MTTIMRPTRDEKIETILREWNLRFDLLEMRATDLFDPEKADQDQAMWEQLSEHIEAVLRAWRLSGSTPTSSGLVQGSRHAS